MVFWSWTNAAHDLFTAGDKKTVYLNMDETTIAYGYAKRKGTVVDHSAWEGVNSFMLYDAIGTGTTHTNVGLLACIASDPEIQRCLPQVLMVKAAKFPQYLRDLADTIMPACVSIWLQQSMWSTQLRFQDWLTELKQCLEPFRSTHEFILVVDASKTHYNEAICLFTYAAGIVFILLPAGLTWLLQPLDVYVFAEFKHAIKARLHAERVAHPTGDLKRERWLTVVLDEIGKLNNREYSHAFVRTGLDGEQRDVHLVDRKIVDSLDVACNPRQHPTREELAMCLARVNVPFYENLMLPFAPARPEFDSQAARSKATARPKVSYTRPPGPQV